MYSNSNDEVIIKIIGKATLEIKALENLEEQLKLKKAIEEVLYDYDVKTREKSLMVGDIEEKLQIYFAVKKLEGMSERTIKNYGYMLLKFANFYKMPVASITTMDIRVFLAKTYQDKKASSVNSVINILKSFFGWLVQEEYIIKNPMLKIKSTKVPKRTREALDQEQLEKFKAAAENDREKAIVEFLASSGCRLGELISVKIADINWTERSLYVIGKGNKQRKIYFSIKAKLLLQKYIENRNGDSEYLFSTQKKPFKNIGPRGVQEIIKKILKRSELDKNVFPHLFRHTFATQSLNSGMSMPVLQKILGHEQASTTQIYAQLNDENVRYEYKRVV
ncbi:MAG: site-specific tyrosine recombinase/integron integrase [Clostridium sp.]